MPSLHSSFRFSSQQKIVIGNALRLILGVHDQIGPPKWRRVLCLKPRGKYDPELFDLFRSVEHRFSSGITGRSRVQLNSLQLATCSFAVRIYRLELRRERAMIPCTSQCIAETLQRLDIYSKRARRVDPAPHPGAWKPLLQWIRYELFAWRPPKLKTSEAQRQRNTLASAFELTKLELERRSVVITDEAIIRREVRYKLKLLARKGWTREWFVREPHAGEVLADFVVKRNQGILKPRERWEEWREANERIRQTLA